MEHEYLSVSVSQGLVSVMSLPLVNDGSKLHRRTLTKRLMERQRKRKCSRVSNVSSSIIINGHTH